MKTWTVTYVEYADVTDITEMTLHWELIGDPVGEEVPRVYGSLTSPLDPPIHEHDLKDTSMDDLVQAVKFILGSEQVAEYEAAIDQQAHDFEHPPIKGWTPS